MAAPEKWVAGTLPKRGAAARQTSQPSAKLAQRVARLRQRSLAGRPLAVALEGRGRWTARSRNVGLAWGIVAATLGLVGTLVGVITGRNYLLIAGAIVLGIGGVLFHRGSRGAVDDHDFFAGVGREAAMLDGYLDGVLPQLPQAVVLALARLKERLAKVVERMGDKERASVISVEEQFFVRELITRYLRDACNSYLAVIRATQEAPLAIGERSPEASLLAQIEILDTRLKSILTVVAASEVDELAKHEAFIETKR